MTLRLFSVIGMWWLGMAEAGAAIAMVVVPDGVGGTRYTFEEVSANPLVPVSMVLSSGFRMELPPGMFVASGPGSGGAAAAGRWGCGGCGVSFSLNSAYRRLPAGGGVYVGGSKNLALSDAADAPVEAR